VNILADIEARLDGFARRLVALEFEARSRLNRLERRLAEGGRLEEATAANAAPAKLFETESTCENRVSADKSAPASLKPRFNRKSYHRAYMREWRARQTALRRQAQGA
jgi:hypothetical protein